MEGSGTAPATVWVFGNPPLPQLETLAPVLRTLTGTLLALEAEDDRVEALIGHLRAAEQSLAELAPADPSPRVGPEYRPDQRVYLDHGRDIGCFNPCFPEYEIRVRGAQASGTVVFPLAYEGPPGLVHGGFLALFFDCIVQHHNCEYGVAGKTTSITVEYRRPTPLSQPLEFSIERTTGTNRITSEARIELDGEVLCKATIEAVAGDRSRLPEVGPRHVQ
jgi:hypothetical protein